MFDTKTTHTTFYRLPLSDVCSLTSDSVMLTFKVPEQLKALYQFVPGQYLTLRTTIDGARISRCYSICSAANSGVLSVAIRKVKGGRFSSYAVDHFAENDVLEVMPPMGKFMLTPYEQSLLASDDTTLVSKRCYVGVAGGSGITPIISMVSTAMSVDPQSHFVLFYANRSEQTMMFGHELAAMQQQYNGRFYLVPIYSDNVETQQLIYYAVASVLKDNIASLGQTSVVKIPSNLQTILRELPNLNSADGWYLCGPQAMTDCLQEVLLENGVNESCVQRELFTADATKDSLPRIANKETKGLSSHIKVVFEGQQIEFNLEQKGEVVLNEALKHRDDLPHACQFGACGTCKAKIVEGTAVMKENMALEDEEVEEGFILTCQAQPTSRLLALSFDE